MNYRGRFAPTPSGPLHMGSLLTALASYVHARAQHGQWLLRIDDLDTLRCVAGAEAMIRQQLEAHGLLWDEPPRYQSQHLAQYSDAFIRLEQQAQLYPCTCTRAQLASRSLPGPDDPVYDGHCRQVHIAGKPHAIRLHTSNTSLQFVDGWQGLQVRQMATEVGDFVVRRADGLFTYQLACAVDEASQGITEVVRGADLLGSTFRQLYVQQRLGLYRSSYRHLPVLIDTTGRKLSKQNQAQALDASRAGRNLFQCLQWLNQAPPQMLQTGGVNTILAWAIEHWQPHAVPRQQHLAVE